VEVQGSKRKKGRLGTRKKSGQEKEQSKKKEFECDVGFQAANDFFDG
jgi:hypothetical protein